MCEEPSVGQRNMVVHWLLEPLGSPKRPAASISSLLPKFHGGDVNGEVDSEVDSDADDTSIQAVPSLLYVLLPRFPAK